MSDSVPVPLSAVMGIHDVREMTFQNIVDRILRPSGIKMGGFPMEMFLDLTDDEQQKFMCNICYMIANDCRCCDNKHVFCRSCILAWSMTFGENSQKCPFCRCNQTEYLVDKELNDQLKNKRAICLTDGCSYKAPLQYVLLHSHGRTNYSNADVDFDSIQSEQRRLCPLLSSAAFESNGMAAEAMDLRGQLIQGRMMIHQMMMLMHLEMQLRQQALVSYQTAQDPAQRLQRLDDVMALNEQLNEVGSILGMLLNAPLEHGASIRHARSTVSPPAHHHGPSTMGGRFGTPIAESTPRSSLPSFRFQLHDSDSDDDDDNEGGVTDDNVSVAASNVTDALFGEDYGRTSSLSDSSVWGSYNFDSSTPTSHRQPRSIVSTNRQQSVSTVPALSTSAAFNDYSEPVLLGRRLNHPTTPQWMRSELAPVIMTVAELNSSVGARSQAEDGATMSHNVTLPQIQSTSGGIAPPSRTSLVQNGSHVQFVMAERQSSVSGSSSGTPRQLEPLARNRSNGLLSAAQSGTLQRVSQQVLSASSYVSQTVSSSTSGASSTSASHHAVNSNQLSSDASGVVTEPWPVLPTTEQRASSLSTNQSAISQPVARHDEPHLSRAHSRNIHLPTGATYGPRRAVHEMHSIRPALQLRRSSVRNGLSRPTGPSSVSNVRHPAPHGPRVVPIPHPPARGGRQQGAGGHSTASSRIYASNDILRPRRRSEIAHDIMFPRQNDSE